MHRKGSVMARVINASPTGAPARELTAQQRRQAQRRLARRTAKNPLRRVRLACEERSQRDPVAVVGDHVWCETHNDFARVISVVE